MLSNNNGTVRLICNGHFYFMNTPYGNAVPIAELEEQRTAVVPIAGVEQRTAVPIAGPEVAGAVSTVINTAATDVDEEGGNNSPTNTVICCNCIVSICLVVTCIYLFCDK